VFLLQIGPGKIQEECSEGEIDSWLVVCVECIDELPIILDSFFILSIFSFVLRARIYYIFANDFRFFHDIEKVFSTMSFGVLGYHLVKFKNGVYIGGLTQSVLEWHKRGMLLFKVFLFLIEGLSSRNFIVIFLFKVILVILVLVGLIRHVWLVIGIVSWRRNGSYLHLIEGCLIGCIFTSKFQPKLARTAAATVRSSMDRMSDSFRVMSSCSAVRNSRSINNSLILAIK
jgi:hypothetical protein